MTTILVCAAAVIGCGLAIQSPASGYPGIERTDLQRHDLSIPGREVVQCLVAIEPGRAPVSTRSAQLFEGAANSRAMTPDPRRTRRREPPTMSITKIDKVLYTARTHTTGGREAGSSRTSDGRLDVRLSPPGTPGTGTNPEQLLAAGWSACYLSAIKLLAGQKKVRLPSEFAVDAEVDLGSTNGAYFLRSRLTVLLPGLEPATAQALADEAHGICPYSKATHGNVEVVTVVKTDPVAAMA